MREPLAHFGVHVNVTEWSAQEVRSGGADNCSLDILVDRIAELGVRAVRIPLMWRQLTSDRGRREDPRPANFTHEDRRQQICRFVDALPDDVSVVAGFGLPPIHVAEAYFDDRSALSEELVPFLEGLVSELPRTIDWELWNEPNASDFYLSRATDAGGHRPWTAGEFIEDAAMPAYNTLCQRSPESAICAATFAENGMVGHDDRPPALSNVLPRTRRFKPMRSTDPHGQFYFIPNFAAAVLAALDRLDAHELDVPLHFGCHPYPYFQIWQTRDPDLVSKTRSLVNQLGEAMNASEVGRRAELWITETGARSFDVLDENRNDPGIQADYLSGILTATYVKDPSRIFVYKLRDLPQDMRQEKTFGLLDHHGRSKAGFDVVQAQAHADDTPRNRVSARFDDRLRQTGRLRANTTFSYVTDDDDDYALVFPGRARGDWIELESPLPLVGSGSFSIEIDLGCYDEWRDLRISVSVTRADGSSARSLALDIPRSGPPEVEIDGRQEPATPVVPTARPLDAGTIRRIGATFGDGTVTVGVDYDKDFVALQMPVSLPVDRAIRPVVRITAMGPPRTPVRVGWIRYRAD